MAISQRRNRTKRARTGKRIELTSRDFEIFRVLARYRYLPSTYIYAFVGGASETRFKERLGDLFHEGYLNRPAPQWELANCRHRPVVHEIGPGAMRALERQEIVEEPRTWLRASADRQFPHALMICQILASIEIATRLRPGLRFISWPEMLAKAPAETRDSAAPFRLPPTAASKEIVPDGLFGIEYFSNGSKAYRFFAVEADRGTMPIIRSNQDQTSCLGKLTAYRRFLSAHGQRTHLGVPTLLVLMVTTDGGRLGEILARLAHSPEVTSVFLFKATESSELSFPTTKLLFEGWERIGALPLQIDG
jgi:hypothetical protein